MMHIYDICYTIQYNNIYIYIYIYKYIYIYRERERDKEMSVYIYIYIYIYIHIYRLVLLYALRYEHDSSIAQLKEHRDPSKGGAVEAGRSDLYDVMY